MTKLTTTIARCDVCEKETPCERYDMPPDPWLSLSISSGWQNRFHEKVATNMHACSPQCAVIALERVLARFKRFPTALADK